MCWGHGTFLSICYGLEAVSLPPPPTPNPFVEAPEPHYDVFEGGALGNVIRIRRNHEGRALMMGLVSL